jgi:hypothetical protein
MQYAQNMQEGNKPALDASSQRTTGNPTHIHLQQNAPYII